MEGLRTMVMTLLMRKLDRGGDFAQIMATTIRTNHISASLIVKQHPLGTRKTLLG